MSTSSTITRRVSLAEVAEAAGVSRMTASRVLRADGPGDGFSTTTRDRVLAAAERLGYVPNRIAATFGSTSASTLVGIALPSFSRDLYAQLLEGLESKLAAVGYQPIVGSVGHDDESERRWLVSALAWRPAGLVLAGRTRSATHRRWLREQSVPMVEIWNLAADGAGRAPSDPYRVGFDHAAVGRAMGEYVAARYSGPIGYVGACPDGIVLGADRLRGFEAGIDAVRGSRGCGARCLRPKDRPLPYTGYYGTEQLLAEHPDTRVIYYLDDAMAFGGLMWCARRGIKVPGDVAIAGFGGMDIGSVLPQRLTTTRVPLRRIGKLAAGQLVQRVGGKRVAAVHDTGFELVKGETA